MQARGRIREALPIRKDKNALRTKTFVSCKGTSSKLSNIRDCIQHLQSIHVRRDFPVNHCEELSKEAQVFCHERFSFANLCTSPMILHLELIWFSRYAVELRGYLVYDLVSSNS